VDRVVVEERALSRALIRETVIAIVGQHADGIALVEDCVLLVGFGASAD
jgi:hypothetical protein